MGQSLEPNSCYHDTKFKGKVNFPSSVSCLRAFKMSFLSFHSKKASQ